jgi:hypothetical protein
MTTAEATAGSEQRMRALERANEVRLARATLKRQLATGQASAAEAILGAAPEIERMTIIELLISQRGWGHARCRRLLMPILMSETKTIGSMTCRQRSLLAATLRDEREQRELDGPTRRQVHPQRGLPTLAAG